MRLRTALKNQRSLQGFRKTAHMKINVSSFVTTTLVGAIAAAALTGCTAEMRKSRWLTRAERDFAAGEYDRAKIEYMKVLQADPNNVKAFQQLGAIWLEEGTPLRAGAFLRRAQELDPQDVANRLRLARVYRAVGQRAEARKEVLTALQQSPASGEALLLLSEFAETQEELAGVEQALGKFPEKETAFFQLANANLALRRQNVADAEQAIARAREIDPESYQAHQAAGVLRLLQKQTKQAGEELKAACALAPTRASVQLVYAEFLRQYENAEAATAFLNSLTKKAPDFLPAWVFLSRLAFAEKKYDEARKLLENVFSRDPQNIDARLTQSETWLAENEASKATEILERLDTTYPETAPIKYRLAQAYLQEDKIPQASTALDRALAAKPDFAEAILLKAKLHLRAGNASAAISAVEALLKKRPELKPASLLLADAYRAAGRFDDAASIFREQIKVSPNAAEPYFFLGVIEQQQKKTDEARQSFKKALELAPDNVLAIGQLIDLDLQEKDFPAAMRRVQEQLEKHPEIAGLRLLEGKVEMAKADWAKAEAALKKALEMDPNLGPAYEMLVSVYLATDRLDDALREIESVLVKAPENKRALMTLAIIRERQKEYVKASEAYEKLLALSPKFVPALNNLAYLCAEHLEQFDKAYELARKARSLDPASPAIADTLGWALFKRGDYQQALVLLQEGADKNTDSSEIRYHLGMAHYMMGQADAAKAAFRKAVAAKDDFPSRLEAERRLALLGDDPGPSGASTVGQLEQLLKDQPNDLITRVRLAEAYEKQSSWREAVGAYEAALKLNPNLASAALKLAQLYGGPAADKEKALVYAKMARRLSPTDPRATALLGGVAFDNGDFSWAYNLLQESARQLATDPTVLHDLAWAAYSLGKIAEARDAMERSLKASPSAPTMADAKTFLTLTAVMPGGTEVSSNLRSLITNTVSARPDYAPALMAAAVLAAEAGKRGEAIEKYRAVLQRFPDFVPAQIRLAWLYAEDPGQLAPAYDLAAKARKALPDDPTVARILGQISYERKDYSRALRLLQESAAAYPLDAIGLCYLGLSYKEAKEPEKAVQALTEAIAGGLSESLAQKARSALSELGKAKTK